MRVEDWYAKMYVGTKNNFKYKEKKSTKPPFLLLLWSDLSYSNYCQSKFLIKNVKERFKEGIEQSIPTLVERSQKR
jgi:predicted GTPase